MQVTHHNDPAGAAVLCHPTHLLGNPLGPRGAPHMFNLTYQKDLKGNAGDLSCRTQMGTMVQSASCIDCIENALDNPISCIAFGFTQHFFPTLGIGCDFATLVSGSALHQPPALAQKPHSAPAMFDRT